MHVVDPGFEEVPAGQDWQTEEVLAPATVEKEPAWQSVHVDELEEVVKDPGRQTVHDVLAGSLLAEPAGQMAQALDSKMR